jgi:hypothetical protein
MMSQEGIHDKLPRSSGLPPGIVFALLFGIATIAVAIRFQSWMPEVFFGDDLANYIAFVDGHFPRGVFPALSTSFAEKYRPVFVLLESSLFSRFGDEIAPYLVFNILIHGFNSALVFVIAQRLSSNNWLISVSIMLTIATSRFALYQVTQVTGLLEGLGLSLFLATFYFTINAIDRTAKKWGWLAISAAFLLINTHERYIAVALWLAITFVFFERTKNRSQLNLIALISACIGIVIFNFLFKKLFLEQKFFVGTGGSNINFDYLRTATHVWEAFLSVFGFNHGPDYLIGASALSLDWFPIWPLAALFIAFWCFFIFRSIRFQLQLPKDEFTFRILRNAQIPLLIVVLLGLVVLPPAMTIRMEQRWLLVPLILVLFTLAWAASSLRQRNRFAFFALASVVGPSIIITDTIYAQSFDKIFFVSSGKFASATKRDLTIDKSHDATPIVLLASAENCDWILQNGDFFRVYGSTKRKTNCYVSPIDLKGKAIAEGSKAYSVSYSPIALQNISSELHSFLATFNEQVMFDFWKAFPEGKISDPVKMDTPSQQGVMQIDWDSTIGNRRTITIITGFSYKYAVPKLEKNSILRFDLSMIYPSSESANAIVSIVQDGVAPKVLFSSQLIPPSKGKKLKFIPISLPISNETNQPMVIIFEAKTAPGKNSDGHWVSFAEPRIVIEQRR